MCLVLRFMVFRLSLQYDTSWRLCAEGFCVNGNVNGNVRDQTVYPFITYIPNHFTCIQQPLIITFYTGHKITKNNDHLSNYLTLTADLMLSS